MPMLPVPVKVVSFACLLVAGLLAGGLLLARRRRRLASLLLGLAALAALAAYGALAPASSLFGPNFSHAATRQHVIALTFDDGPDPRYTPRLLDLLRRHQARATFFVSGGAAARYPQLIRRMVAEGHQVGNHAYHHYDLLTLSPRRVRQEVAGTQAVLARCGVACQALRPPYGFRSPVVYAAAREQGLQVVGWSVSSQDWRRLPAPVIVRRVLARLAPGQVIVFHDGRGDRRQTVRALALLLPELEHREYRSLTIAQLQALPL